MAKEILDEQIRIPGSQISGNAKIIAQYDGTYPALSCAVLPERSEIAVGWCDGHIEVLNSESLLPLKRFNGSKELPATSLSVYKLQEEKQLLLSSFASGETIIWDLESNDEVWKFVEDRQSLVNAFNCDHKKFAVGGSDAKITVYDVDDQKLAQVLQGSMDPDIMDGHTMRIFGLRFHPTRRNELLSGGWDDTIQFWDIRESYSSRKIRGPHICGDGIDFLDDNRFVTASWQKRNPLEIWDYRMGKLIDSIKPDEWNSLLYCCQYVATESVSLVGGSHKNMMRVLDMNSFKSMATIRDLPGAVYFAKELPKREPLAYKMHICFCSAKSVYVTEVEVL